MFLGKKIIHAGLVLGILTTLGAAAQAQQPSNQSPTERTGRMGRGERRGPGPGGRFRPRMLSELNLTDDQKQQVRSAIQQSFAGNKAAREELRQLGAKRRQGTLSPEDQARAKTLHEQMRASMKETHTKISGVLTAEQKARAGALLQDRRTNRRRLGPRRGFRDKPGQANPQTQKPSNPSNQ